MARMEGAERLRFARGAKWEGEAGPLYTDQVAEAVVQDGELAAVAGERARGVRAVCLPAPTLMRSGANQGRDQMWAVS